MALTRRYAAVRCRAACQAQRQPKVAETPKEVTARSHSGGAAFAFLEAWNCKPFHPRCPPGERGQEGLSGASSLGAAVRWPC